MSDYLISLIRTVVPTAVGAVLAWMASRCGIVLDDDSSAALTVAVAGLLIGAYYAVVRALEARWPWLGALLGRARTPVYAPPEPEAAKALRASR